MTTKNQAPRPNARPAPKARAKKVRYKPSGVCAQEMIFTIENGVVTGAEVVGGCAGNSQGMSRLVVGMPADEIARRLKGVRCGGKPTSCPDQLAQAMESYLKSSSIAAPRAKNH